MTTGRRTRPRVALYVAAVLLPCLVLAAAGVYVIRQERDLAARRLDDERRLLVTRAAESLLIRLEHLKLNETRDWTPALELRTPRPANGPVVLAGLVRGSQLVLAPELASSAEAVRRALAAGEFARFITSGERFEFTLHLPDAAARNYQLARDTAAGPLQSGFALLALGRVLLQQGDTLNGNRVLSELARYPLHIVDEHGVPVAFYAAARLGACENAMLDNAPSAGLSILRPIVEQRGTSQQKRLLADRLALADRIEYLQAQFPALAARYDLRSAGPVWAAHGDPPWLVGVNAATSEPRVLVVRAAPLLAELGIDLAPANEGRPLGPAFPNLRVRLPSFPPPAGRERLILIALAAILTMTLFGAFLAWADFRREMRIAALRSDFVSSVTHELKTPLAAIRLYAETLRARSSLDNHLQIECAETIAGESERLSRLVDNVLDFSKAEQNRRAYRLAPAALSSILDAAVRAIRYPMERAGFMLHLEVAPALPTLHADADALEQAILNLLTNAIKYSGESKHVWLYAHRENGDAVIRVRDEGVGIAPDQQRRIFERFYRVPSRGDNAVPGAGLGLALVEHIAHAHGGRVEVASELGRGSTFSIRLPVGGPP